MKISRKIAIVLLSGLVIGLISCSEKKFETQQQIQVEAPVGFVFEQVNDLNNRKNWSDQWGNDSKTALKVSKIFRGKGAKLSWEEHETMGTGSLEITGATENSGLWTTMQQSRPEVRSVNSAWTFVENENRTLVTLKRSGKEKTLFGWGGESAVMQKEVQTNLDQLKVFCESQLQKVAIKKMEVDSHAYLTIRQQFSPDDQIGIQGRLLGEIFQYLIANGGVAAPKPIAIYYARSTGKESTIDIECGIPVDRSFEGTDRIKYKMMSKRNAVVVSHFGTYDKLDQSYKKITSFMNTYNIKTIGAPWEEYVTDPGIEKDTTKWETRIYFPAE